MKVKLKKVRDGLIPVDDDSMRWFKKHRQGYYFHFDVKRYQDQRIQELLDKYWKMLSVYVDNSDQYRTKDDLHHDIKWALDYVEYFQDVHSGKTYKRVKSIALDKMSQKDFEQFFSDAINVLLKICPVEREDLANLILGFS